MINKPSRWDNDRPYKEECRKSAVDGLSRLDRSLWMPGDSWRCIEVAEKSKVIDKRCQLAVAERDPAVIPVIENKIKTGHWEKKPFFHKGELSSMKVPWKLQFAFLDFCGCYDLRTAAWMKNELAPKLEAGARVAITHTRSIRNNNFMHRCNEVLRTGEVGRVTARMGRDIGDRNVALVVAVTLCIFNRWDYDVEQILTYRDSINSMFFLRLDNFRPLPKGETNGWPDIAQLISGSPQTPSGVSVMPKKNMLSEQEKKRSNAAHKAWATRRLHATVKSLPNPKTDIKVPPKRNDDIDRKLDQALKLLREIKDSRG